jgi:hypothetical protein
MVSRQNLASPVPISIGVPRPFKITSKCLSQETGTKSSISDNSTGLIEESVVSTTHPTSQGIII